MLEKARTGGVSGGVSGGVRGCVAAATRFACRRSPSIATALLARFAAVTAASLACTTVAALLAAARSSSRRSASSRRERKSEPRESRTSLSARADCCRGARRRADAQSAAAPGRRIEEFALLCC